MLFDFLLIRFLCDFIIIVRKSKNYLHFQQARFIANSLLIVDLIEFLSSLALSFHMALITDV